MVKPVVALPLELSCLLSPIDVQTLRSLNPS